MSCPWSKPWITNKFEFFLPNCYTSTHSCQAMYQNVAILSTSSAMNEVIAHGKVLRKVLKRHSFWLICWVIFVNLPDPDYPLPLHTNSVCRGKDVWGCREWLKCVKFCAFQVDLSPLNLGNCRCKVRGEPLGVISVKIYEKEWKIIKIHLVHSVSHN